MNKKTQWAAMALLGCGITQSGVALAQEPEEQPAEEQQGFFSSLFSGMDFSLGGFVRPEFSIATGDENPYNQGGNVYNGVPVQRHAGDPFTGYGPILANSQLVNTLRGLPIVGPIVEALPVVNGQLPITDTVTRPVPTTDNTFNMAIVRAELEAGIRFSSDLSLVARVRALYDPGFYDDINAKNLVGPDGMGIVGGDPALYHGTPSFYEYRVQGKSNPNPLEWNGQNYQVYFPA
ncbi:MAG: hypothetical protein ACREVL_18975, partial [Solimonas sp.]